MSEANNYVRLHGTFEIARNGDKLLCWPAENGKKARCIGSIRADGKRIDVQGWEDAAVALGNADGLTITATGRVGYEQPKGWKKGDKTRWPMCVVIEAVEEHAPRGHGEPPPPSDDDFGF